MVVVAPANKCSVSGCFNTKTKNPNIHFFWSPSNPSLRGLWLLAVGKELSVNTSFLVCQDHFDMINDVKQYRVSDHRPVLKQMVVPHLNMNHDNENICASGPSTHNAFYCHQTCQTETKTRTKEYRSVECQTDPIEFGNSLGTKRKALDMSSSLGTSISVDTSSSILSRKALDMSSSLASSISVDTSSSILSNTDTSDSIYEPALSEIEEADEEDEENETKDEFDDDDSNTDSGLSDKEKIKICDFTIRTMENNLLHYTGIPKESSYVIDLIVNKSGVSKRNVFLILRKIRHNESLTILGDAFGISRQYAGRIFTSDIEKIATSLQPLIYWPEPSYIKLNLPLQFKHKYKNVQVIIDCFETSIGKPKKPLDQALSWSQYKHSNTVKYLIGCTPDGVIIFISKGFPGRISDNEIVRRSGFLNFLKKGTVVMADRGFKDLNSEICSIDGVLIKPPSVTAGVIYTSEEAKMCKSIAATRIHVERVIGKIRNFAFLKPQHSLLSSKRTYLLEFSITIASAICNMQGLLIKI